MTNPFAQPAAGQQHNQAAQPQQEQTTGQPAPRPTPNLSQMFNNGANAGGDKLTDLEGNAVLIRIGDYVEGMQTQNGPANAIQADWVALDGSQQGTQFSGLIFGTVIVSSLKRYLEKGERLCVGVVAKGVAKQGKNAPWLLNPLDDDQLKLAGQAVESLGWQ